MRGREGGREGGTEERWEGSHEVYEVREVLLNLLWRKSPH